MSFQSGAASVSKRYRPELTGVRAVAILCVLGFQRPTLRLTERFRPTERSPAA